MSGNDERYLLKRVRLPSRFWETMLLVESKPRISSRGLYCFIIQNGLTKMYLISYLPLWGLYANRNKICAVFFDHIPSSEECDIVDEETFIVVKEEYW